MSETGFELSKSEKKEKIRFPGISAQAFEHPLDRAALVSLQKVPAVDKVLRFIFRFVHEKRTRLDFLASCVRVNENQFAFVNDLYTEALEILDVEERPELFIMQTPEANAFAFGIDRPFIAINSALVSMLSPEELQAVIAHELGHVVAGHMLHVSVLQTLLRLLNAPGLFGAIPGGRMILQGFIVALFEWFRKAELTCDRAGLLVTQDIEVCHRVEMKLSGGKHIEHMNIEEFFKQADEYEAEGDALDSIYKILNNMYTTHPRAVIRVKRLQEWHDTGSYRDILKGNYTRRDEEEDVSATESWRDALEQAREDTNNSEDTLTQAVSGVANSVIDAGQELFGRLFNQVNPGGSGGSGNQGGSRSSGGNDDANNN